MSNFEDSPGWPRQEEAFAKIVREIKKIIETKTNGSFDELFSFYQEENPDTTENDLVTEIMESGEYQVLDSEDYEEEFGGQLEADSYEEKVMIGYIALAGQYGLIE